MALSLYERLTGRWRDERLREAVAVVLLSPQDSLAAMQAVADVVVFGPPRPAPVLREAITVHTCKRCWCQQAADDSPCWQCGGPVTWWDPPLPPPEPVQVATVSSYGND
ncbi:MAG TPA: hypothetical protein VMA72_12455 [Streptosporangiaceae bacterium]|nr:hypothetical protein [Streptosporangiaceae bacterium]